MDVCEFCFCIFCENKLNLCELLSLSLSLNAGSVLQTYVFFPGLSAIGLFQNFDPRLLDICENGRLSCFRIFEPLRGALVVRRLWIWLHVAPAIF